MFHFSISKLGVSRMLMVAAILLIVAFQAYWLQKLYMEEAAGFKKTTDIVFRETMYKVQAQRLKKDSLFYQIIPEENNFLGDVADLVAKKLPEIRINSKNKQSKEMVISMNENGLSMESPNDKKGTGSIKFRFNGPVTNTDEDSLIEKRPVVIFRSRMDSIVKSSVKSGNINITQLIQEGIRMGMSEAKEHTPKISFHATDELDTVTEFIRSEQPIAPPRPPSHKVRRMTQDFLVKSRTLNDTISIPQIDSAYKIALSNAGINAAFSIKRDSLFRPDSIAGLHFSTSKVPVGFLSKNAYQASFEAPTSFLMRKIAPQILLSLLLVAFTSISFLFLYRNLLAQRRLTLMKNDFISNITHELKTPIATVNVAIEALRNFDALQSPERTKEYLDISASELQRLSLLVDKVLKLSMFENKDIELQKSHFNLKELVEEVMHSMRLQFQKNKVAISFKTAGEPFNIHADRLHITSVIYNLLDNALKYGGSKPEIKVELAATPQEFKLRVEDNGIGISPEYANKVFEKFFRVPSGDHHNIKGYGLGLSYAAHVVHQHGGTISVESQPGKGSAFTIKLPNA
jgi:two-component system, OmpR family, phosphate regulon sensor histidine kinase PhoR